jgi:hypothetical protein
MIAEADLAPRQKTEDGDRHPWNDTMCSRLERVLLGRAATEVLAGGKPKTSHSLATLPAWMWAEPRVEMGRKSRSAHGGSLLLPIRVIWSSELAVLLKPGDQRVVGWTLIGSGYSESGETTLVSDRSLAEPGSRAQATEGDELVPPSLSFHVLNRPQLNRRLAELEADGKAAMWELISAMESHLRWVLERAHTAVSAEINGGRISPVLDEGDKESIITSLLLGDDKDGAVIRMLERCLLPTTFARVDPQKYVMSTLRPAAETAIRRSVGDPHIGRKVREFARQHSPQDLEELVKGYREAFPSDHLSSRRAATAMLLSQGTPPTPCSLSDPRHAEALHDHSQP